MSPARVPSYSYTSADKIVISLQEEKRIGVISACTLQGLFTSYVGKLKNVENSKQTKIRRNPNEILIFLNSDGTCEQPPKTILNIHTRGHRKSD